MFDEKSISIYSSRDRIRQQIIDYMKDYLELEGLDLAKTSYLSYIINILSILTANILYYSSSIYREFFLTKALQKESVLNISSMIGYSPPFAVPAKCSVLLSIPLTFAFADTNKDVSIEISSGFNYYAGNIPFRQDNKIIVTIIKSINNVGQASITATVQEIKALGGVKNIKNVIKTNTNGIKILYFMVNVTQVTEQTFEYTIPEQQPYEFYTIDMNFTGQLADIELLTTNTVTTSISDTWSKYDSLFLIPYGMKGFVFRVKNEGGQVFFGNDVVGKQPASNSICNITVSTTQGEKGNVIAGSITKADNLYAKDYDSINGKIIELGETGLPTGRRYNNRPIKLSIINTEPAQGGKNFPTVDEMRTGALENLKSLGRLVSKPDYDGIGNIVQDLPVYHLMHVIKRSDVKSNEISLFTDIIYNTGIIPTRCCTWEILESENPNLTIYSDNIISIDGIDYYSMFNFDVIAEYQICNYFYLVDNIEEPVTINQIQNPTTTESELNFLRSNIIPKSARFMTIITDSTGNVLPYESQLVRIIFNFDTLTQDTLYPSIHDKPFPMLGVSILFNWDSNLKPMQRDYVVDDHDYFILDIPLLSIPNGEQTYSIRMVRVNAYPIISDDINLSQISVTVKQDLDEFMYSPVKIISGVHPNRVINVYNVPVIKKSYYDDIKNDDVKRNAFDLTVYNKILSLDITKYRMITDFVNLKFGDTTGLLTNMQYNTLTKRTVKNINPTFIPPVPSNGDRYIVINALNNPWKDSPYSQTIPFIAEYSEVDLTWIFTKLAVNDYIYVSDIQKKLLFNGKEMVDTLKGIPFEMHIVVWRKNKLDSSESDLINIIKNKIIEKLYTKFGFDKNIYISEIVDAVQSLYNVDHCNVLKPEHDIFFNYNVYKDLTQHELLEYSPQLVWTNTSEILVEVI